MFMGLLYGSFFANEEILVPFEHLLTGMVLGRQQDRFVTVLPEPGPLPTLRFFAFGEILGIVMMLTGMVINIVNLWRRAEYKEALLGETGVVTAFLCLWAAGIFVRVINGMGLEWFDVVGLGLPFAILLFCSPTNALRTCTELLVNGVTYLMIGAYAMSHALLSMAFSRVALLVSSLSLGSVWELLVYALGNFVILALEGTIVLVQCQRLMVSEFFPKFLAEPGKSFVPLRIVDTE
jgi:V/A-type H+-transporting ATPase subunit I